MPQTPTEPTASSSDQEPEPLPRVVELTRDLIRLDTSNYGTDDPRTQGEAAAAAYIQGFLERLGLAVERFESLPGRVSLVTRIEGEDNSLPPLIVHGHMDVVPADPALWTHEPFAGDIEDGALIGRGAVDMKDMLAMMLSFLEKAAQQHLTPRRPLIFGFFADEECGGVWGAAWVAEHHPEVFANAEDALSEIGGYSATVGGKRVYLAQTGEKGLLWLTLTAHGTASHGSLAADDNPVRTLAEVLVRIANYEWPPSESPTVSGMLAILRSLLPETPSDADVVAATGYASAFIKAGMSTTATPTGLSAGYASNVVPSEASATVDVRPLPGTEDATLDILQQLAGPKVTITIDHRDVGPESPPDGPLLDTIRTVIDRHDPGALVSPYFLSAGTDNKSLSALGIRGYGFVPLKIPENFNFPGKFHGVDEAIPLSALTFGDQVLTDLLLEY